MLWIMFYSRISEANERQFRRRIKSKDDSESNDAGTIWFRSHWLGRIKSELIRPRNEGAHRLKEEIRPKERQIGHAQKIRNYSNPLKIVCARECNIKIVIILYQREKSLQYFCVPKVKIQSNNHHDSWMKIPSLKNQSLFQMRDE